MMMWLEKKNSEQISRKSSLFEAFEGESVSHGFIKSRSNRLFYCFDQGGGQHVWCKAKTGDVVSGRGAIYGP